MKKLLLALLLCISCVWQLKSENQSASVTWLLTNDKQQESSISGQLEKPNLNLKGLMVNSYGGPDASITITLEEGVSSMWHTSENGNKYIEFSVTPKKGSIFHIDEISFNACGKGGSNMRANFYYSKDPDFVQKTKIAYKEEEDLVRDKYEDFSVTITETIQGDETLYFRIYPYYKSAATGKYICLKNIAIKGYTEATAVDATVLWPFTDNFKATINGSLIANNMIFGSGIELYDYTTSIPTLDGTQIPGGSVAPPKSTSCAWTASDAPIDDIYIQYQVSPKTGATFTVTDVSVLISAFATDKMKAAIYYSKNVDFTDKTELKASTAFNSVLSVKSTFFE